MFYISDNKDEFLNLPKILYENDPFYTTKVEDIPQDAKLFVVKNDDKIIARCALIYNETLSYQNYKTAQVVIKDNK